MKISIITVSYNSAKTIRDTIKSVISQGFPELEYIIIDGGSSDGTCEIVQEYSEKISYFISEPDSGIYSAMNKGIAAASGSIVGILNSDDWYEEGAFLCVEKAFLNNPDIDVIYGRLNTISKNGEVKAAHSVPFYSLCYQMATPHPTVFVRKKIYDKYGYFDSSYRIAGDFELMNRLWSEKVAFGYLNKFLANFRTSGISSLEKTETSKEVDKVIDIYFNSKVFIDASFRKLLKREKPLHLWGMGIWGKRVLTAFSENEIDVTGCYDISEDKVGTRPFEGLEILSPKDLKDVWGQLLITILNPPEEIVLDIKRVNPKLDIVLLTECLDEYGKFMAKINGNAVLV